jgi:hypothetical protein
MVLHRPSGCLDGGRLSLPSILDRLRCFVLACALRARSVARALWRVLSGSCSRPPAKFAVAQLAHQSARMPECQSARIPSYPTAKHMINVCVDASATVCTVQSSLTHLSCGSRKLIIAAVPVALVHLSWQHPPWQHPLIRPCVRGRC